jgi:transcription antitermination factor NusG
MFWHVFACRPGKERAAAQELGRRGLLPLVPVLPIKYRQGNRYWRPLALPGYVLIQIETLTPKVLRQILVADFSNGEKCVRKEIGRATPKQMLEFLAFIESLKGVLTVKQSVKAGDVVHLKYGEWEGKKGEVQEIEGDRVNLLIGMFKVRVKADAIQLEKEDATGSISLHKSANHGTTIRRDGGRSRAAGGQSRL